MVDHGAIAIVRVEGTDLASFSAKETRPVVVAWAEEDGALVYPLSSNRPPKGTKSWPLQVLGRTVYAILDRGLFRIPASHMTVGLDVAMIPKGLSEAIRQHIHEREERAMGSKEPLKIRSLADLAKLKREEPAPSPTPSRVKRAKDIDPNSWEDYLAFGLDEDLKHPGFDGRPRRDK